jgi:tRNA-uridine 2-sulfurtransferase
VDEGAGVSPLTHDPIVRPGYGMKRKAISLLSGGLDSILATKLVLEQSIEVVGLHFTSPFMSRRERDRGLQAVRSAAELGIRLIVRDKGAEYIEVIQKPEHGYGRNMNPCIDCRIFMLRKTKDLMAEEGASFVVTGEVLGQRPMSQRRETIRLIEKASGLDRLILRPLSAKHFEPTFVEQEGVIDRTRLCDIAGRGRTIQYRLADTFHLREFGCPGGGCLLTDQVFAGKLRDLFRHDGSFTATDLILLNIGRHFRLNGNTKLVVGRNQDENERLEALRAPPYMMVYPIGFKGPQAILKGDLDGSIIAIAANIIGYYSRNVSPAMVVGLNNGKVTRHTVPKAEIDLERLKI